MKCPFELPVKKIKLRNITNSLYDIEQLVPPYTKEQADYIVTAINSHEKLAENIKHIDLCLEMMQTDIDCNVPLSLQRIKAYIKESGETK